MAGVNALVTLGLGPDLVQRIREVDSRLRVWVLSGPLPPESELWRLHNVIISPHIAGETAHYNERAVALFCQNLRRYLADEPLLNIVDPETGY